MIFLRRLITHLSKLPFFALMLMLLLGNGFSAMAQDVSPVGSPQFLPNTRLDQASFSAYTCTFDSSSNSVTISAALTGADGRAIAVDTLSPNVGIYNTAQNQTTGFIPSDRVSVRQVASREPLNMVVVFDLTDTMPMAEVVRAFSTSFAGELNPQDEVAIITFSTDIAPISQFYTDKNRLVTEHLVNATTRNGDNRLYDAIYEAVSAFSPSTERQAVLVITDSGRRANTQTPTDDIIQRARAANVQIYSVGFVYEDTPDNADLLRMGSETHGYTWIFDGERSRVAVGSAVSTYLTEFIRTLNSEVEITLDLTGQSINSDGQITFEISMGAANERDLVSRIACPVRSLNSTIAFANVQDNAVLSVPINVTVTARSELDLERASVAFWLNDVIIQNTNSRFYTLNAADMQPGIYNLRAELRDMSDQILATTEEIQVYVQQALRLNSGDGVTTDLRGRIQFQAIANLGVDLADVQFRVGTAGNPNITLPIGVGTAPMQSDGRAVLIVEDIQAELVRIFPNETGNAFVLSAFVPGTTPEEPLLAESNRLSFTTSNLPFDPNAAGVTRPQGATGGTTQTPLTVDVVTNQVRGWFDHPLAVPALTVLFLLVLNILLFRQIRRSRIRRMIYVTDNEELSDRLMAITVRRQGAIKTHTLTKKTIYIGRGARNDINVGDDVGISRNHGVVMWRKGAWYFANRNSRILTRIDGKRYRGWMIKRLEPITEIEIGNTHLYFHSNAQQDISELTKTNI